jgi:uncharacterized membrane protein
MMRTLLGLLGVLCGFLAIGVLIARFFLYEAREPLMWLVAGLACLACVFGALSKGLRKCKP